jgi:hypothetical protein
MFTDEDDIHRALTGALHVRPAPDFERRVLEAAADRAQTRRLLRNWLGVAAAVILTAGVWALSGLTALPPMPDPERVTLNADPRARMDPAPPDRQSARASAGAPIVPKRSRQRGAFPSARVSQGTSEPEVLVPANQLTLIDAFAREINGGRVRLGEHADPDERLRILIVPEMTVQPIAITTLEAAVPEPDSKGLHE